MPARIRAAKEPVFAGVIVAEKLAEVHGNRTQTPIKIPFNIQLLGRSFLARAKSGQKF